MDFQSIIEHTECERVYDSGLSQVYWIDEQYILKVGEGATENAVKNMNIVKDIMPVPNIIKHGEKYTLMQYVEGDNLEVIWDDIDNKAKSIVENQLYAMVQKMRSLKCNKIGPLREIMNDANVEIPCCDNLNDFIRYRADLRNLHFELEETYHLENVMSHNDLYPRNIIVGKDMTILAILDWEFSGFCPYYYEYKRRNVIKDYVEVDWDYMFKDYQHIPHEIDAIENKILF